MLVSIFCAIASVMALSSFSNTAFSSLSQNQYVICLLIVSAVCYFYWESGLALSSAILLLILASMLAANKLGLDDVLVAMLLSVVLFAIFHSKKRYAYGAVSLLLMLYFLIKCAQGIGFITVLLVAVFVFVTSKLLLMILDRVTMDISPTFLTIDLGKAASFLSIYILMAFLFGIYYHFLHVNDKNAFTIMGKLSDSDLDSSYFIYWSFGVFATYGPSELAPKSPLARWAIVLQSVVDIAWLSLFLACFSNRLQKEKPYVS